MSGVVGAGSNAGDAAASRAARSRSASIRAASNPSARDPLEGLLLADDRSWLGAAKTHLERVRAEGGAQRHGDRTELVGRDVGDRGLGALGEDDRDAVAGLHALRGERVREPVRARAQLPEADRPRDLASVRHEDRRGARGLPVGHLDAEVEALRQDPAVGRPELVVGGRRRRSLPQPLEHPQVDLRRADELGDGHRLDVPVGAAAGRAVVDRGDAAFAVEERGVGDELDPCDAQLARPSRPRSRRAGRPRADAPDRSRSTRGRASGRARSRSPSRPLRPRAAPGTPPRRRPGCSPAPSDGSRPAGTSSGSGCRSPRRAPRRGSTSRIRPEDARPPPARRCGPRSPRSPCRRR